MKTIQMTPGDIVVSCWYGLMISQSISLVHLMKIPKEEEWIDYRKRR